MIIEAMTMARPIIAPDHGGAVEMIEDGITGLLFRPGYSHDLASKISLLQQDINLRKSIGQSARTHALNVFSISEHVRQVQNVYKKILRNS